MKRIILGLIIMMSAIYIYGCGDSPVAKVNTPPEVISVTLDPSTIVIGDTTLITCSARDLDGDTITYAWSVNGGTLTPTTAASATWRAPSTAGTVKVTVIISDGKVTAEGSANITVRGNHAPVIRTLSAIPANVLNGSTSTFSCEATDADGDSIVYSWVADAGTFSSASGKLTTWTAPGTVGSYTATVTATDGTDTASQTMTVFVYSVATKATAAPDPPTSITRAVTRTSATITWSNVSGANIYNLSYGTGSEADQFFTLTTSPFVLNDLLPGTIYFIKIASENSYGVGTFSDTIVVQTLY